MILIINYDLKKPRGTYTALYDYLKGHGTWWHYLASTWLISTTKTPLQVSDEMKEFIQPGDHILIVEFTGSYNGWLPKKAWEWIKKNRTS